MPRRPRPLSRIKHRRLLNTSEPDTQKESDSLTGNLSSHDGEEVAADAASPYTLELVDDADAPRVAQWIDEDELEDEPLDDDARPGSSTARDTNLNTLKDDLSSLPMGTLRRAQQMLSQANVGSDEGSSESESEFDLERDVQGKIQQERDAKSHREVGKRSSKHAPMEVTSKKPVTRRRTVIEVKTPQARDPRFLSMTGEFSSQKFHHNYRFLNDAHKTELSTLRETLKRARKLLASSPRELRPEREAEVERLELAVRRAVSMVNKDRRDQVEQDALQNVKKQEREKRQSGKGDWWMKESDKKKLLIKARYDALASQGGQKAVKKAIEKKQKKIGQKEKKSRPFAKGHSSEDRASKRPLESSSSTSREAKRRKLA